MGKVSHEKFAKEIKETAPRFDLQRGRWMVAVFGCGAPRVYSENISQTFSIYHFWMKKFLDVG